MISAIGFAPQPPLLVPEVASGAASELDDLRAACDRLLQNILIGADELLILGSAQGVDIGTWLAGRTPWAGPTTTRPVNNHTEALTALRAAAAAQTSTAVLALGDGSACRTEKAPGYLDKRSFAFDDYVADALDAVDVDALTGIDQQEAHELLVAGRLVWPAIAQIVRDADNKWTGELSYRADPYGVSYFVAEWKPAGPRT